MWTHEVKLEKYEATTLAGARCSWARQDSHGNEWLQVKAGEGWEGLAIKVVFRPCKVSRMVPEDGLVSVPWEATKDPLTAVQGADRVPRPGRKRQNYEQPGSAL